MNILYLFARKWHDRKMSIGRALYGHAVGEHPGVKLDIWGPGWPGYNERESLAANLDRLSFKPDLLWFYKAEDYSGVAEVSLPKLVIFNEANDIPKTYAEVEAADATHVGFHHMGDLDECRKLVAFNCRHLFHLPHGTEKYNAEAVLPLDERSTQCLVAGVLGTDVYPLRCRLAYLVREGVLPGVVRKHPGYRLESRVDIAAQYIDYRVQLADSKVLLTDTSIYRYPLAKPIEAAMAGCVPATDLPTDKWFADAFGEFIIELNAEWSDRKIADTVKAALKDARGLQQRSDGLRQVAEREFTIQRYAERLVAAVGYRDARFVRKTTTT